LKKKDKIYTELLNRGKSRASVFSDNELVLSDENDNEEIA
jgi:hypothetical protein